MANTQALLQGLEQTLAQLHPSILPKLNNGLSNSDIESVAASLQLTFTTAIYDLFSWKNGIQHKAGDSPGQLLLFSNGIPYTLAEAADQYKLLALSKHIIETNYFPLFSSGNNDILVTDLDQASDTYSMIGLYSPALLGNNNVMTIYDSFASMIQTAFACYLQKAYWIDQDSLVTDADSHYSIASGLNPNSAYWQFM